MNAWPRALHIATVILLCLAGLAAITIVALSLFASDFVVGEPHRDAYRWLLVPLVALAVAVKLAVSAIRSWVHWRWLGLAALVIGMVFFWLAHDDPAPPPRPDLGRRVAADDAGYQVVMWMAERSPHCRLQETGAPPTDENVPQLPADETAWRGYVAKNHEVIVRAWDQNTLGRAWITALAARPPGGIWPQGLYDPMIALKPVRATIQIGLARAYAVALNGRRDEAIQSVAEMIRAMQSLQRTSGNPVHAMVANLSARLCYRAADAILQLGAITLDTRLMLQQALETAPPTQQVLRNAILGDRDFVHDVIVRLGTRPVRDASPAFTGLDHWIELGLIAGGRWAFNANRTESLIATWHAQICGIAEAGDLETLKRWTPDWRPFSRFKNPMGRLVAGALRPDLQKVAESAWETVKARIALARRIEATSSWIPAR